jgi:hypothetical protein
MFDELQNGKVTNTVALQFALLCSVTKVMELQLITKPLSRSVYLIVCPIHEGQGFKVDEQAGHSPYLATCSPKT